LTLLEGNAQADARNESRNEGQEECVIGRATCHERQHRTYAVQSNSGFSKVWTWKQNGEEPLRQVRHEAQHVVGEKVRHGRYISTHQCCHLFQLLQHPFHLQKKLIATIKTTTTTNKLTEIDDHKLLKFLKIGLVWCFGGRVGVKSPEFVIILEPISPY
jgi:hypothetical protein